VQADFENASDVKIGALLSNLRSDARFGVMLKKMNLPA